MATTPTANKLESAHLDGIPPAYSSVSEEYHALRNAAGLVERTGAGRLRIDGSDALDLLDRLSTNNLATLETGHAMYTVLTSAKGRILDLLLVVRFGDHLLVATSPQNRQKVADHVDFFNFGEDVAIDDVTDRTAMLGVTGPSAGDVLAKASGGELGGLETYACATVTIGGQEAVVVRTDFLGGAGYDVVIDSGAIDAARDALLDAGEALGFKRAGAHAIETVRIECGVPVYGRELSEDYNPLEANLLPHISFNKICYTGQEVVARLNTYEKVQRHLVGLRWDNAGDVGPGADLYVEGKKVGHVTSAAAGIENNGGIGLGYVRKAHAFSGIRLDADSPESGTVVEVVELSVTPSE